jgi:hypothetical protein
LFCNPILWNSFFIFYNCNACQKFNRKRILYVLFSSPPFTFFLFAHPLFLSFFCMLKWFW